MCIFFVFFWLGHLRWRLNVYRARTVCNCLYDTFVCLVFFEAREKKHLARLETIYVVLRNGDFHGGEWNVNVPRHVFRFSFAGPGGIFFDGAYYVNSQNSQCYSEAFFVCLIGCTFLISWLTTICFFGRDAWRSGEEGFCVLRGIGKLGPKEPEKKFPRIFVYLRVPKFLLACFPSLYAFHSHTMECYLNFSLLFYHLFAPSNTLEHVLLRIYFWDCRKLTPIVVDCRRGWVPVGDERWGATSFANGCGTRALHCSTLQCNNPPCSSHSPTPSR